MANENTGLRSANDQFKKSTFTPFIRKLKLGDGEKAWFRYMSTGESDDPRYQTYNVHTHKEGDKWITDYCTLDDNGECARCLQAKPTSRFGVWVWVDYILRKRQNPGLGKNDKAEPWKKLRYREELYYKQDVNNVMLWESGPGMKKYIFNQVFEAFQQYGTLMDRIYVMSRTGAGVQDTNYLIKPVADQSTLNEKQMEVYRLLPPVTEVVSGRQTWPPKSTEQITADEGEEIEELDAPEPTIITAEPDELNFDDSSDDDVEELDEIVVEKPDVIAKTIDDALNAMENDEPVTAPTRLRPRGK